jgi:hypothetical protein
MSTEPKAGVLEGVDWAEVEAAFFSALPKLIAVPVSGSMISRALDTRLSS